MPSRTVRRKSSKRRTGKRSKVKRRSRAYEIARPNVGLSSRSLVSSWQIRAGPVLSVLLLVALSLITSQFFTTDKFYIYGAEVEGNRFIDSAEVYKASGLHEWSIFWVNPERAEAKISKLSGVKEVKVTCWLPNHVSIKVVEHQVQIVWQRGEQRYWVDEQGALLPVEEELEDMLVVQDLTPGPLEVGDRIDPEVVRSALELKRLLPETEVLQYSEDRGVILNRSFPVYLGTGDMAEKITILDALVKDLAFDGIQPEYVDLRYKESPCYKY